MIGSATSLGHHEGYISQLIGKYGVSAQGLKSVLTANVIADGLEGVGRAVRGPSARAFTFLPLGDSTNDQLSSHDAKIHCCC